MNELWDRIIENYKIARKCLVYSRGTDCWTRQEDKGMYHLWSAYYTALNAEEKNVNCSYKSEVVELLWIESRNTYRDHFLSVIDEQLYPEYFCFALLLNRYLYILGEKESFKKEKRKIFTYSSAAEYSTTVASVNDWQYSIELMLKSYIWD